MSKPGRIPTAFLDWTDRPAVRRFMLDARQQVEDIDGVIRDTFLPPRERQFGPAAVQDHYEDALRSLRFLLDFAVGPDGFPPEMVGDPDPAESDPAGSGDAGPTE
jgi:hypothetical protein